MGIIQRADGRNPRRRRFVGRGEEIACDFACKGGGTGNHFRGSGEPTAAVEVGRVDARASGRHFLFRPGRCTEEAPVGFEAATASRGWLGPSAVGEQLALLLCLRTGERL